MYSQHPNVPGFSGSITQERDAQQGTGHAVDPQHPYNTSHHHEDYKNETMIHNDFSQVKTIYDYYLLDIPIGYDLK